MNNIGLYLKKNLQNQEIEFVSIANDHEYIQYAEGMTLSQIVIRGVFLDYDEESGILIFQSPSNRKFFVSEESIEMFWEPGLNLKEIMFSSLNSGSKALRSQTKK